MCTSTAQNCQNRKCIWRGDRITCCISKKLAAQPCVKRFCVGGESVQPNVGHHCGNTFPLYLNQKLLKWLTSVLVQILLNEKVTNAATVEVWHRFDVENEVFRTSLNNCLRNQVRGSSWELIYSCISLTSFRES